VQHNGELVTNPPADIQLDRGAELVMLGDAEQRQEFVEHFGT
jgi:K+/H+ antiporter YhaU regulatory subunit KhtT